MHLVEGLEFVPALWPHCDNMRVLFRLCVGNRQRARQEGHKKGIDLLGELIQKLKPLGRINELIAAHSW